jgi:hypothetical protein
LFDRPKPTAGCSASGRRRYNDNTFIVILPAKQIRNALELWKCGSVEVWRRSVAPSLWKMKYYTERSRKGANYIW